MMQWDILRAQGWSNTITAIACPLACFVIAATLVHPGLRQADRVLVELDDVKKRHEIIKHHPEIKELVVLAANELRHGFAQDRKLLNAVHSHEPLQLWRPPLGAAP